MNRIDSTINGNCSSKNCDSELDRAEEVLKETEEFPKYSKKQRKEFKRKSDPLTRTRSGKIPVKPLTKKQKNWLQAIPRDTLIAFLKKQELGFMT